MKISFFISSIVLLSTALASASSHSDKCYADGRQGQCMSKNRCHGVSVRSPKFCDRGEYCCLEKKRVPRPEVCHDKKGHSGICKKEHDCSHKDTLRGGHCSGHSQVCCDQRRAH